MTPQKPRPWYGSAPCRHVPVLLVALCLTACEDEATNPFAGVVAEETAGALALGVRLPDPGGWTMPEGASTSDAAAVAEWIASWDLPGEDGREARTGSHPVLAALFVGELGRGGVAQHADRLSEGLRRAEALAEEELPEHMRSRIAEASREHASAVDALRSDDPAAALAYVLKGADALREVGPEAVARTLVSEVDAAFGRLAEDDTYSEEDLERIDRLLRGGRQALREGNWVRAIRRAYYARGLIAPGGA